MMVKYSTVTAKWVTFLQQQNPIMYVTFGQKVQESTTQTEHLV